RDRIKRSLHLREQLRFRLVIERAGVRHLPARLRVNRRAVQNDFAALAGFQLADRPALGDNRPDAAVLRARSVIEIQLRLKRLRQLHIRWIRRLLRPAFPRRSRLTTLLFHRAIKTSLVEIDAAVASSVDNKIKRETKCVVESESFFTVQLVGTCSYIFQFL